MDHRQPRVLVFVLVMAATAGEAAPSVPRSAGRRPDRPRHVAGEVIVKLRRSLDPETTSKVAARAHPGVSVAKRLVDPETGLGDTRVLLVRFPESLSVERMVARYRAMPEVAYAEPNYIATTGDPRESHDRSAEPARVKWRVGVDARGRIATRLMATAELRSMASTYPADPQLYSQWGWSWVGADIVWPDMLSGEVAVIDTGVDATHPDLAGLVINAYDFINNDRIANDDDGHGTHVAGIIAARTNDKNGIAGVSRARIYAVKVLGADGSGTYFDVAQGIRKAANRSTVKVLNMSLGGSAPSDTLQAAVEYATLVKGKLIVAAAGNGFGSTAHFYPAGYSDFQGPSASGSGNVDLRRRVIAVASSGITLTGLGRRATLLRRVLPFRLLEPRLLGQRHGTRRRDLLHHPLPQGVLRRSLLRRLAGGLQHVQRHLDGEPPRRGSGRPGSREQPGSHERGALRPPPQPRPPLRSGRAHRRGRRRDL